jgi:agmatine deiminase
MEQQACVGDQEVTIGLVQMKIGSDPEENITCAINYIEAAINKGAQIVCLPELFHTRYFPQAIRKDVTYLADTIPGKITDRFVNIAKRYGVVLIVPLYEKSEDGHYYNSAVVIDTDGNLHPTYHKVHIPQDPGFYEKGYFHPGNEYHVYNTCFGCIAVLICFDQWFPEAARSAALMGASIIFYPTAIGQPGQYDPVEGEWQESWELIQRSHAIANSVHVAAVNRVGTEGKIRFFGGSFMCDAFGKVIARAGAEEDIIIATLDLSMNRMVQDSWGFFRNRRPDTYGRLVIQPGNLGHSYVTRPGDTPRNRGFSMPAEWEPHDAVWLSWPNNPQTFPDLQAVEETYIQFISAMQGSEEVELLIHDSDVMEDVRDRLCKTGPGDSNVTFRVTDYEDIWIRDYGPTFIVNPAISEIAMVRWRFNAWGEKYKNLIRDKKIPGIMNGWLGLPVFEPGIILEGGSIDVNGRGTIMTTRSCLLNPNRNPGYTESDIEGFLMEYLGADHVIWLKEGITGDDTDGHIDDIARFTGPSTVVCASEDDRTDDNYQALEENYDILVRSVDQDGNPLRVVKLPMPDQVRCGDDRYPASYTNFYIGNSVVVVPVFNDPHDSTALKILGPLFPGRKIIGIDARAMVEGRGTYHCATQQQPRIRFDTGNPG